MTRENSFSDEDGRSLTPDIDEDAQGPIPQPPVYSTTSGNGQEIQAEDPPKSPITRITSREAPRSSHITPKARFRQAVRKVMALHRTSTILASYGAGAEPGVDPRRATTELHYGGIRQDCVIQIFDYSSVRNSFGQMTNKEFVDFLDNPSASYKEPWVKVRWINIAGKSWDVIRALVMRYDLHPLAVEDVFHSSSQTRSKADYFPKHLFLKVLCHELSNSEQDNQRKLIIPNIIRSSSPVPLDDEKTLHDSSNPTSGSSTIRNRKNRKQDVESRLSPPSLFSTLDNTAADNRRKRLAEEAVIHKLKEDSVDVKISSLFIFLLRDGTVISLHEDPLADLTRPIASRLNHRDTVLRTSADPSMLVQSLLDLIVDKALEVVDEYQLRIMKLERSVLLQPNVKAVKKLHILSGELILHKRTLEPIKRLVYTLRRYDRDHCAALIDTSDPANADVKVVGYMSHRSIIYLADVHDHMEYILTTLDMIANVGENLINYAFNMKSYEMNEVMRRLTLATIIFLPLTLLTGYFGMNFTFMWSIHNDHSDVVFWIIALPMMAIVVPLFLSSDLRSMAHYVNKKFIAKQAILQHQAAIKSA